MQQLSDRERWSNSLKAARREINLGHPSVALEIISPIRNAVDALDGSIEWIELPLLTGEALVAIAREDALSYLNTAAERAKTVEDLSVEIQIRIQEHLGHYFRSVARRPSKAREHYAVAKQIGSDARCFEDVARIQLKICEIDLVTDSDPQLANYRSLMRLGKADFTSQEILAAWMQLLAVTQGFQPTIRSARKFNVATDTYLLSLLKGAREKSK